MARNRKAVRYSLSFTLIELLVVVAIIAVLISILLPALAKAKKTTRQVTCSTRFRTLVQGCVMFANDNHDFLPDPPYFVKVAGKSRPVGGAFQYYGERQGTAIGDYKQSFMALYTLNYVKSIPAFYCYEGWSGLGGTDVANYQPSWNMYHISLIYLAGPNEFLLDLDETNKNAAASWRSWGYTGTRPLQGPTRSTDDPRWRLWADLTWNGNNWYVLSQGLTPDTASAFSTHRGDGGNVAYLDGHVRWKTETEMIPFYFFKF